MDFHSPTNQLPRKRKRVTKPKELKAQPVSIRLYSDNLEALKLLPGDNLSQKIRFGINELGRLKTRERRQVRKIEKKLTSTAELARAIRSKDFGDFTVEKQRRIKRQFLDTYQEFEAYLNFFEIDQDSLVKLIPKSSLHDLNLIFLIRSYLHDKKLKIN